MSVGRLTARVVIGGLVIGHGTQKLFGWLGGPGRAGTEAMMDPWTYGRERSMHSPQG